MFRTLRILRRFPTLNVMVQTLSGTFRLIAATFTKVQILTQKAQVQTLSGSFSLIAATFALLTIFSLVFAVIAQQVLILTVYLRYSLLYFATFALLAIFCLVVAVIAQQVLRLLALLVPKYEY